MEVSPEGETSGAWLSSREESRKNLAENFWRKFGKTSDRIIFTEAAFAADVVEHK